MISFLAIFGLRGSLSFSGHSSCLETTFERYLTQRHVPYRVFLANTSTVGIELDALVSDKLIAEFEKNFEVLEKTDQYGQAHASYGCPRFSYDFGRLVSPTEFWTAGDLHRLKRGYDSLVAKHKQDPQERIRSCTYQICPFLTASFQRTTCVVGKLQMSCRNHEYTVPIQYADEE